MCEKFPLFLCMHQFFMYIIHMACFWMNSVICKYICKYTHTKVSTYMTGWEIIKHLISKQNLHLLCSIYTFDTKNRVENSVIPVWTSRFTLCILIIWNYVFLTNLTNICDTNFPFSNISLFLCIEYKKWCSPKKMYFCLNILMYIHINLFY